MRKIKLLFDKIFKEYLTGKHGKARIPTYNEVYSKIYSVTKNDYNPLLNDAKLMSLNIKDINDKFKNAIDDIDILYKSIQDQSFDIYNQLSNSLIEFNGLKRELKNLSLLTNDTNQYKYNINNFQFVFTENFNTYSNINTSLLTNSLGIIPVIDLKSGLLKIPKSEIDTVDLSHYYGTKLDIRNTDYSGSIINAGYVGNSDAGSILDINDIRELTYLIKTSISTSIKSSFILKLKPDGSEDMIQSIILDYDFNNKEEYLNIQYKKESQWIDFTNPQYIKINNDRIIIENEPVNTSYIKIQFYKLEPDISDSNEYVITIRNLSITRFNINKEQTVISKSIPVSIENNGCVINTISTDIDYTLYQNTSLDLYVAKDSKVKGYFVDKNNNKVNPSSLYVDRFIYDSLSIINNNYVLLSDMYNNYSISGVMDYLKYNDNFKWLKIENGKSVNLETLYITDIYDNSISSIGDIIKLGDEDYLLNYSGYPQPNQISGWFLSGYINSSNENWSNISGLVPESLWSTNNINDTDDASYISQCGYPLNFYNPETESTLMLGEYKSSFPGWWRESSYLVTPSGIVNDEFVSDVVPDFHFNNINFYKIFRFNKNDIPIENSIKLYSYETSPITKNSFYTNNMIWNYNKYKTINTYEYIGKNAILDSILNINLDHNFKFIRNSITNVSYFGKNNIFIEDTDYTVSNVTDSGFVINFSNLVNNSVYSTESPIYFKYSYELINSYSSYWEGYIINENETSYINIIQKKVLLDNKVIDVLKKILITKLDGSIIYDTFPNDNSSYVLEKGNYKLKIFCDSDYTGNSYEWVPYNKDYIFCGDGLRIVSKIDPLRIIDFDVLLHSTMYSNDDKCSIIEENDGYKYVVVKEPSKNTMPGYYFDNLNKVYKVNDSNKILNRGHYKRTFVDQVNGNNINKSYITGSWGNNVVYLSGDTYIIDTDWNDGLVYPDNFINADTSFLEPLNISTYIRNHKNGPLYYFDGSTINYTVDDEIKSDLLCTVTGTRGVLNNGTYIDYNYLYQDHVKFNGNVSGVYIDSGLSQIVGLSGVTIGFVFDVKGTGYRPILSYGNSSESLSEFEIAITNDDVFSLSFYSIDHINNICTVTVPLSSIPSVSFPTACVISLNLNLSSYGQDNYDKIDMFIGGINVKSFMTIDGNFPTVFDSSFSTQPARFGSSNSSPDTQNMNDYSIFDDFVVYSYSSTIDELTDLSNYILRNAKLYPTHSTYGTKISLEGKGKSNLFYNTAENLPAFYSISYGYVKNHDTITDRFLYKIHLKSEDESLTPVVNSIKFIINKEE